MSEQQAGHTPGPWQIQEVVPSERAVWTVAPEGHDAIESQTDREPRIAIRGGRVSDQGLFASGDGPNGLYGYITEVRWPCNPAGRPQALANARLIASAPALLEALREMVAYFGCTAPEEWLNQESYTAAVAVIEQAEHALAAATGTLEESDGR